LKELVRFGRNPFGGPGRSREIGFFRKYAQVAETAMPLHWRIFIAGGGQHAGHVDFVPSTSLGSTGLPKIGREILLVGSDHQRFVFAALNFTQKLAVVAETTIAGTAPAASNWLLPKIGASC
jgi:hypothetical protein